MIEPGYPLHLFDEEPNDQLPDEPEIIVDCHGRLWEVLVENQEGWQLIMLIGKAIADLPHCGGGYVKLT